MSRYARRIDENQPALVETFRALGCEVKVTSHLGSGFPDCVIRKNGERRFIEIKDGSKPPSARSLTKPEQEWAGLLDDEYRIVETASQAHAVVAEMEMAAALRGK